MRDKTRIKPFLEEFGKIWEEECPDWRFGQIVSNLESKYGDLFYCEEDVMMVKIKDYFKRF